jgi:hypothetical protein
MNLNGTWQQPVAETLADIDAPHPATFAKVEIRDITDWMPTDDAKPVPKSSEMSTRCRMAEEIIYDAYDGEVSVKPIVKHQFYDEKQKRWNSDIATTELTADRYLTVRTQTANIPGTKDRFGRSIDAYERKLASEGRPLPVVLLADKIYPAVINACESLQIASVEALANADKATIAKLDGYLRKSGNTRMADQIKRFQDIAKARLESLGLASSKKSAA